MDLITDGMADVAQVVGEALELGDVGLVDDVEDGLGDGGVDPIDDAVVDHAPFGGALRHRCWSPNMVLQPELPEDGVQEGAPLGVVGFLKVEDDGDVGADVHRLKDGG